MKLTALIAPVLVAGTLLAPWGLAQSNDAEQQEPGLSAQEQEPVEATSEGRALQGEPEVRGAITEEDRERGTLETLEALRETRDKKVDELDALRDNFDSSVDSELRLEQIEQAKKLGLEIEKIDRDFESIATGIDLRALEQVEPENINLIDELTQFLEPLISELRDATETPREIERLSDLKELISTEQLPLVAEAIENLTVVLESVQGNPELRRELNEALIDWQARQTELQNELRVVEFQLDQRLRERGSIVDSTSSALGHFFRTRGLNLILAIATFFGVLLLLRILQRQAMRLFRKKPREERAFYARLLDVIYFAVSGLIAVMGSLLVLYSAGDWTLLGLALLALLGLAWASKTAIPIFLEQIQLLLNLGSVREMERVIVNDLPWRVTRISMHATLVNPRLAGGRLRLPLRDLLGLRSRPSPKDEPWFPTQTGDWVRHDDRLAQVEHQGPDLVQLRYLGGSEALLSTVDFLSAGAENLSHGFRVSHRFGVDYSLQDISTSTVAEVLEKDLRAGVTQLLDDEEVLQVRVEFLEAGASSLDYILQADLAGSAAPHYERVKRALQRIVVESCTREGWGIPFAQLVVHRADGE